MSEADAKLDAEIVRAEGQHYERSTLPYGDYAEGFEPWIDDRVEVIRHDTRD